MLLVVDQRCSTQFSNLILYYHQVTSISTYILYICIFILCLYQLLVYMPSIEILQKIGEYSDGIFLVHAFLHSYCIHISSIFYFSDQLKFLHNFIYSNAKNELFYSETNAKQLLYNLYDHRKIKTLSALNLALLRRVVSRF